MLLLSSFVGLGLNATAQLDNVWVNGYILHSGNGSAISGATVYIQNTMDGETNFTTTNATGFYNISMFAPPGGGVFQLSAFHSDYLINSSYMWLAEGFNQSNVILYLDPALNKNSYVQGTIRDAITMAPLPFTGLSALGENYINTTSTNATGDYRMFLESNQRYYIQVSRNGYEDQGRMSFFNFGDNKVFDFLLEPTNCTLSGYVTNLSGSLGSANVLVYRFDQMGQMEYRPQVNATTGYFELNLSRGVWQVEVENGDHFTQTITVLLKNDETTWQNFTLQELPSERATISGWITYFENGSAAPDVEIATGNKNGTWRQGNFSDGVGYYNISVIPGDLFLSPRTWGYMGGRTSITTQDGGTYTLNMTLIDFWNQDGFLEGYVRYNAIGEPDVQVIATYDNWWSEAWTDGSGYYNMSVPGAPLDVYAVKDGFNASFAQIDTNSSSTTMYDFDLSLIDWSTEIRGYVNNTKGDALEGAFFSYDYDGPGWGSATGMTDYTGLYQMMAPSGDSSSFTMAAGHEYKTSDVTLPQNQIFWNNETLTPVATDAQIICKFTNILTGKPIRNVEVNIGEMDLDWFESYETDKSGIFKADVPAGFVQVSFDARENGYKEPGMYRDPSTMQFRIKSSETRWLNISLFPRDRTAVYQGYVNDTGGSPIVGANVQVRFGDTILSNTTDATGYYKIRMPGDTMFVSWARAPGYKVQYYQEWIPDQGVVWYDWTLDNANAWIEGPISDSAEDLDADTKFDYLYVNVTVNVANFGNYRLEGSLSEGRSSNQGIASADVTLGSTLGPQLVTLAFMGEQIRNSELNGYYVDIMLRDDDTWENLDYAEHFTTKYRFDEFEIPDATIETPVEYWLVDSDFDGLFNYLIINATLNVTVPGDYTLMTPVRDIWGTEFEMSFETFSLEAGLQEVQLSIDGTSIYNNGETLGSVYMVLFEGFPTEGMDYVDTLYFYTPLEHDIFQFYVIDAYVSGIVTDSGGQPIEDMTVWLYNITYKYLNSTTTNSSGYYELGGWAGDWVLVVNDDDTGVEYQGDLTEITLSTGMNNYDFLNLQYNPLDIIETQLIFSDWNNTHMDWLLLAVGDSKTLRFEMDVLQFGNGDGFFSEDEAMMVMGMLGGMSLPANSNDSFMVDGIWYDLDQPSMTVDAGLVGPITSTDPVYIHLTGDYIANSTIPDPSPHDLDLNCTYDDVNPQIVTDNNATFIYYVTVPSGWGKTGNGTPLNVTISGSDYITFDPLNDPNPGDGIDAEWVNVTVSIGEAPTVGIIKGNVTLDGSGDHSGVVVSILDNVTLLEVASGPTNPGGYYEITGLTPGNYTIVAHKAGYMDNITYNVSLNAGDTLWFDFTLYSFPPIIIHNPVTSAILGDVINIACDVTDDGEVDSVILYYKDVGVGSFSSTDLTLIPSTSTYMGTIPGQIALGFVDYYIWANDTKGNWGTHPEAGNHSIWIYEITPPDISLVSVIPDPAEYQEFVNISAQVTDFSNVESVSLFIEFPDLSTTNLTMIFDSLSGRYYLNSSFSMLGTYNYVIWANDSYDNWNSYSGSFDVLDTILPTSSVDLLVPYWFATSPAIITAQASDSGIGVENVGLWYRYSSENSTWGNWTLFGVDLGLPWSWNFDFPDGDGYYEFFSIANDSAGNPEALKNVAETICTYDTTVPTSAVNLIAAYWQSTSPLVITASATDDLIGIENVELWFRNSTDNLTWSSWVQFGIDTGAPWSWDFTFSNGDGYYEFYSIANDSLGNPEPGKALGETICAFDSMGPTSGLNVIASYWQSTIPLIITAGASDDLIGVQNVELWYRNSSDNTSWSVWTQFGIDPGTPWSWNFNFPDGDGYYEFFSIANDSLGNAETMKVLAETICAYDTTEPISNVNVIASYWQSTSPLTITSSASDDLSGLQNVELWFRNSTDNSSWGSWTLFGVDSGSPWSWNFDFPAGDGYYEFFSLANDSAANVEIMKIAAEIICAFDSSRPTSSVNPISVYWRTSSPLTITVVASDPSGIGLDTVSLWYQYSSDDVNWGSPVEFDTDSSSPWSFSFDFLEGEGYYEFYSIAEDLLGNTETAPTSADTECALDTLKPQIDSITITPDPAELGQSITITVSLSDVSGIDEAWVEITLGGTTVGNFSMTLSGVNYEYVYRPNDIGTVTFDLWVTDNNGNWNTTSDSAEVQDTTAPSVDDFTVSPANPEVGSTVSISVTVSDASVISEVYFNITDPDGNMVVNESINQNPATGAYGYQTDYIKLGEYKVEIWVVDENDQWTLYEDTVTTIDTQDPQADAGPTQQVTAGTQVTLNGGDSTDNFNIANYTWEFNDNGLKQLYGATVQYTFGSAADYEITLTVRDSAGNTDESETYVNVSAVSGTGTVTGTVLDKNGNPVEGAEVFVEGYPNIKDTTDSRGVFILDDVPIGSQSIRVVKGGYDLESTTVDVAQDQTTTTPDFEIAKKDSEDEAPVAMYGLLAAIIAIIVVILLFLMTKKKPQAVPEETVIDEVFLMYTDGRLIKHFTRRLRPDMDEDILSSMLVAVQDFIKDSFKDSEAALDQMTFGRFQVLMGRGEHIILATLIQGEDMAHFKPQVQQCVKDIEEKFGDILSDWDGEVSSLQGASKYVMDLIDGKYAQEE
jgi:hypothetical protein